MAIVQIERDRCKGCELCVSICRFQVLGMDKNALNKKGYYPAGVAQPEKCTGCANCALMCPDSAIKVMK